MVTAVARMRATTQGRMPERNALTPAYCNRLWMSAAMSRMMKNEGSTTPSVAQIAPAGSWRVWAEPETGGEAYIPLAAAKRIRSLEIWRETGRRLGVTGPQHFANGGVIGQHATTGALSRPGDSYASVTNVTHQYHFEGREALGWLNDHLRDGQRRSYQTGGVHG